MNLHFLCIGIESFLETELAEGIIRFYQKGLIKLCMGDPSSRVRYCALEHLSYHPIELHDFISQVIYFKCFDKDKRVRILSWQIIFKVIEDGFGEPLTHALSLQDMKKLLISSLCDPHTAIKITSKKLCK